MIIGWLTLSIALTLITVILYFIGISLATVGLVLAGAYVGVISIFLIESYNNRE